jgi:peptidoglycan/xylan/chitin deacetylase (PgdA/CDA1 family)
VSVLTNSYYGGLRAVGIPALRRRLDGGLILCYHNVVGAERDRLDTQGLHETRGRFERQMHWLVRHYQVVSLREFVNALFAGASMRSLAAVTFDDGYRGVFEHAVPILTAFNVPATIFVVTGAVGTDTPFVWDGPAPYRPADWATIRAALNGRVELGAHSTRHPSLPALGAAELEYEVVASRARIEAEIGVAPEFFAYPYGHWDRRVRDVVRSAGYRAAVTLDFGLNTRAADPWALRRVNVPAGISDAAFEAWTAGCRGLKIH